MEGWVTLPSGIHVNLNNVLFIRPLVGKEAIELRFIGDTSQHYKDADLVAILALYGVKKKRGRKPVEESEPVSEETHAESAREQS